MLLPGDLFIWVFPNAGNPQKVQRYPDDWAVALRKMAVLGLVTMKEALEDPARLLLEI